MMKLLLISKDSDLINFNESISNNGTLRTVVFNSNNSPLEIVENFLSAKPDAVIIDDDFMKPNSVQMISTFSKLTPEIPIIFITSDDSLELGKDVSQLGIYYYGIKPISKQEYRDLINSLNKKRNNSSLTERGS